MAEEPAPSSPQRELEPGLPICISLGHEAAQPIDSQGLVL